MLRKLVISALFLVFLANSARSDIFGLCLEAVETNENGRARLYAQEILEIRGAVTPENRNAGARCLTLTKGKEYIYDTVAAKFSTLEEAAKNLEFQREIDRKAEDERKESERRLAEAERAAKEAEERAESAKLAAAESAKLAAEARRREDAKTQ